MGGGHEEYFTRLLKSCGTFLARWQGTRGELLELTSSHKSLTIGLFRAETRGNLVIHALDPLRVRGPVRWEPAHVSIARTLLPDEPDGRQEGFRIFDEKADMEILCGALEISENVKRYEPLVIH